MFWCRLLLLKSILITGLWVPTPAFAQEEVDEKVVVCQNHEVLLTARGDIAVVDSAHQVQIYLSILHENQLVQNDNRALKLTGAKKRMGMILSQQKIEIDYKTGKGFAEDSSVSGSQAQKKIELKSCRRSG